MKTGPCLSFAGILLAAISNCSAKAENPESLLDSTFVPHIDGTVTAIAVQADGKALIGRMARLNDGYTGIS